MAERRGARPPQREELVHATTVPGMEALLFRPMSEGGLGVRILERNRLTTIPLLETRHIIEAFGLRSGDPMTPELVTFVGELVQYVRDGVIYDDGIEDHTLRREWQNAFKNTPAYQAFVDVYQRRNQARTANIEKVTELISFMGKIAEDNNKSDLADGLREAYQVIYKKLYPAKPIIKEEDGIVIIESSHLPQALDTQTIDIVRATEDAVVATLHHIANACAIKPPIATILMT